MNVTFLIPLKSPKYINSVARFTQILKRTLEYTRKVPNSNTIIVCNEYAVNPSIVYEEKILVVPDSGFGYGDDDKEYKVYRGMMYWLMHRPKSTHVMILDFDDLVLPEICWLNPHSHENIRMNQGYQKVFNRKYWYKENFWYHCGSSFIFSRPWMEHRVKEYERGVRWMFHQHHKATSFTDTEIPCVIQVPWNGENVWWNKMRFRDVLKYFVSEKM